MSEEALHCASVSNRILIDELLSTAGGKTTERPPSILSFPLFKNLALCGMRRWKQNASDRWSAVWVRSTFETRLPMRDWMTVDTCISRYVSPWTRSIFLRLRGIVYETGSFSAIQHNESVKRISERPGLAQSKNIGFTVRFSFQTLHVVGISSLTE